MQPAPSREPTGARRTIEAACALVILGNMLWFGREAFTAVFNGDDVMNLYGYWSKGPWRMLLSQVLFFSPDYRPMGGMFYLPLYWAAGLRPLPYHAAAFVLMAVNVWLVYRVACKLSGSRMAAWLTAFLASYNVPMAELYYQTGVIYDILCFLFYFWALDYYFGLRGRGEPVGACRLLALAALYACALNSKEMAVTLPVILLAYDLAYFPPKNLHPRSLLRWAASSGRAAWVTGLMTAAYIYGKTHGPDAISSLPGYQGVYSAAQFVEANRAYLVQHFLGLIPFSAAGLFVFWALMLALAFLLKRRDLILLWVWAIACPLPVVFVQRGHSAVYIPFAGLALFASTVLVLAAGACARMARLQPAVLQSAAAVTLAILFARENSIQKRAIQHYIDEDGREIWSVIRQFDAVRPRVEPHCKVLLLDSPFPNWDLHFISALWIGDRTVELWLDRPGHRVADADRPDYKHVLRFEQGRLVHAARPQAGGC